MDRKNRFVLQKIQAYSKVVSGKFRQITWKSRALPDFIIIGAQKGGTTSLFYYLSQHPQLIPSCVKEVHYFDGGLHSGVDQYQYGIPWYHAHFPFKARVAKHQRIFEASPSYLFHQLVPQRIHQALPTVKLIALLRNPTHRAISHYLFEKRRGRETLEIMDALLQEEERLKPIYASGNFNDVNYRVFSYKSRGLYKCQLERYFQYFPREQLLIIPSERFFAEPVKYLRMIFDFVDVNASCHIPDLRPRNVASNRIEVARKVYDFLDDFFRPHNHALYEFLGQDFGW